MLAANVKNYGSTQSTGIENRGYVNHAFDFSQDVATSNGRDIKTSAVTENAKLAKQAIDNVDPLILELRKAIDNNDINLIKRKVKENPKVINQISPDFCRNRTNATMLLYAIAQNKVEVVKELIASGADIDAVEENKIRAFCQASILQDTSILELLLKKSSLHINTCSKSGWYPLHTAVSSGNLDAVKVLVEYGANVDAVAFIEENKLTTIYQASALKDTSILEFLLKKSSLHINTDSISGVHPLHFAVSSGNLDAVKLLVEHGADIDAVSGIQKTTAIYRAASLKDTSILELLLKKSSLHINTGSISGVHPLHCAAKLGNLDAVKLLISYGADINVYTDYSERKNTFGLTPLVFAVSMGHVEVVECLLENKADVNEGTIDAAGKKTVVQAMCHYRTLFDHADFGILKLKEKKYEILAVLVIYGAKLDLGTINTIMGS